MNNCLDGRPKIYFLLILVALLGGGSLIISQDVSAKPTKDRAEKPGKARGKRWVTPENSPPSIAGSPASEVLENSFYDFAPVAQDVDEDPLTFAIENKPAWADFDPSAGALYGEPTGADVGRYEDIRISVSDGHATAELPAFSIDVNATGLASVTLSWQAPTENTDGTQLTDLAGYRIYYGLDPLNFSNVIEIPTAGITTYVVANLTADTWYFAATAFNHSDVESDFSGTVARDTR